jgi:hypothetical protein
MAINLELIEDTCANPGITGYQLPRFSITLEPQIIE